jgi:hypothetical protein
MLAKFGKFPFEHFAWGQALLYYNRVSTITKDYILGKAWEARYACYGKKMLGWIREKMATQESTLGGGKFSASSSTVARNGTLACNNLCALGEDYSIATRNGSWDNAHTSNSSNMGERLGGEPSTLVQRAQRMGGSLDG